MLRRSAILGLAGLTTLLLVVDTGSATAQGKPTDWGGPLTVTQIDAPPTLNGYRTNLSSDAQRAMYATLVPNGTGVTERLAVRDLPDGQPTLLDPDQIQLPVMSADGQYIGYSLPNSTPSPFPMGNYDVWVQNIATGETTKVSVAPDGTDANSRSLGEQLSETGRYVAFSSDASNLVDGDTNGVEDVFVRDLQTGVTTRVSVASDGTESDGYSAVAGLSATGQYVLFRSAASNLVPDDTNGTWDLFLHDMATGTTSRVDVANDGTQADGPIDFCYGAVSSDGRYATFASDASDLVAGDTNGVTDVFVRDLRRQQTSRVSVGPRGSQADGRSLCPLLSADGRYLAFGSEATNLVSGDTNDVGDVFLRDLGTRRTVRVSVRPDGSQTSTWSAQLDAISADGTAVAFNIPNQGMDPNSTDNSTQAFLVRP